MHRGLAGRHSSTSLAPHPRRPPAWPARGPLPVVSSPWCWPGPCVVRAVGGLCCPQRSGCGRLACAKFSILLQPASQEKSSLGTGRYRHLRLSTSKRETSSLPASTNNTFIARRRPSLAPYHCCILHFLLARRPRHSTRLPLLPLDAIPPIDLAPLRPRAYQSDRDRCDAIRDLRAFQHGLQLQLVAACG